ncbi:hypothetical protein BFW38_06785 [Terasakiispira papahanaumokuakeensis]|uniref:HMA domain-containing protein n=1 Tax=Terasakiispira papahanaumokuakeensis TaxID=197479 RepID=A0A1E2V8Y7_9GAMM|nr:cation transporter [Terasakiispira papahanaumokuakeensis]ODC03296.1 hypothetical protein BFW38_06785 [Terasakiispira papahanaumokuakeensis]
MAKVHLQLSGLTCGGCVNKVTQALMEVEGVESVEVSQTAADIEGSASLEDLIDAVEDAGYEAEKA